MQLLTYPNSLILQLHRKVSKQKLYLPRQKKKKRTLIFFKIVLLAFNTLIPASFPFLEAPLKLIF